MNWDNYVTQNLKITCRVLVEHPNKTKQTTSKQKNMILCEVPKPLQFIPCKFNVIGVDTGSVCFNILTHYYPILPSTWAWSWCWSHFGAYSNLNGLRTGLFLYTKLLHIAKHIAGINVFCSDGNKWMKKVLDCQHIWIIYICKPFMCTKRKGKPPKAEHGDFNCSVEWTYGDISQFIVFFYAFSLNKYQSPFSQSF